MMWKFEMSIGMYMNTHFCVRYVFLVCTRPPNHAKVNSHSQSNGQDTMTRLLRLFPPNRVMHRVSVMLGHIQFLLTLLGLCPPQYTSDSIGLYIGDENGHMISKCVSSCCNSSGSLSCTNYMWFRRTVEFATILQWVPVVNMTGTQWSEPTVSIC